MAEQSSIHFYLNWAKERIDEMDATLASLESKTSEVHGDARMKANQVRTDLRKKRDDFRTTIEKQAEANEATWIKEKARLESEWSAFESEVKKYIENFGKQIEQQQAIFQQQANAQVRAWRAAADHLSVAAKNFAAERRAEIEVVVQRMDADADQAEEKLQRLNQAGSQSWSALTTALSETRAAFDRANQAAQDAFRKAAA